mmetsp:Transcript_172/g.388  ORF Transcript_172/g.388 Transcript_172/m.388 type:complete len:240 (-) Transcript_172:47-766(-)
MKLQAFSLAAIFLILYSSHGLKVDSQLSRQPGTVAKTCASFKCTGDYVDSSPSPASVVCNVTAGCSKAKCCVPSCGTHLCDDGWTNRHQFMSRIGCYDPQGCSDEVCCTPPSGCDALTRDMKSKRVCAKYGKYKDVVGCINDKQCRWTKSIDGICRAYSQYAWYEKQCQSYGHTEAGVQTSVEGVKACFTDRRCRWTTWAKNTGGELPHVDAEDEALQAQSAAPKVAPKSAFAGKDQFR